MRFDAAIKRGKTIIWIPIDAPNEMDATKKIRAILKDRYKYKLYAGPLIRN